MLPVQTYGKEETIGLDAEARLGIRSLADIPAFVLKRDPNGSFICVILSLNTQLWSFSAQGQLDAFLHFLTGILNVTPEARWTAKQVNHFQSYIYDYFYSFLNKALLHFF